MAQVGPELIKDSQQRLLAMIIRASFQPSGISFFTPPDFSQQVGLLNHKKGAVIDPHLHNDVSREVRYTQEVLIVRKGRVRIDFFEDTATYIGSVDILTGDAILLIQGGHGFEMLEDSDILEIKQGPFMGEQDKTRFTNPSPLSRFQIQTRT